MSARGRGRDPHQRRERRFLSEFFREARKLYGSHVVVARRRDQVDVGQLVFDRNNDTQLRVLPSDVDGSYITNEDVGLFWFVPGYSMVGGPDIMRP